MCWSAIESRTQFVPSAVFQPFSDTASMAPAPYPPVLIPKPSQCPHASTRTERVPLPGLAFREHIRRALKAGLEGAERLFGSGPTILRLDSEGAPNEFLFVVKRLCWVASGLAARRSAWRRSVLLWRVREWLIREWPQLGARQHPAERQRSRVLCSVAIGQAAGSSVTEWPRACSRAIRRRVSCAGSRRRVK